MRSRGLSVILLAAVCSPLAAQWKVVDKGIPRLRNGQPDLNAAAPRRADGKPDLTGIWVADPPKVRDATVGLKPGEVTMTPREIIVAKFDWHRSANCSPADRLE